MGIVVEPKIWGKFFTAKSVPVPQNNSGSQGTESGVCRSGEKFCTELPFKTNLCKIGQFTPVKTNESSPKYSTAVKRELPAEMKLNDTRNEFEKDYDRIINSGGYDRLRLKAQSLMLFDSDMLEELENTHIYTDDMVTTRITHVVQVANIAGRISDNLGLNKNLTQAIAIGHDIGHTPFGHRGEAALRKITAEQGFEPFWHEKNSLRMVDYLLTLKNDQGNLKNLNLTYAVRDGIICHCGEVDQNALKPRDEVIDLESITKASEVQPYTWEGCVVKVADKIAYLGRDIEDAQRTGILSRQQIEELNEVVKKYVPSFEGDINNSFLINLFINDIVQNSSPQKGIAFSKPVFELMNEVKKFNYENIYNIDEQVLKPDFYYRVLKTIFDSYNDRYCGEHTIERLLESDDKYDKDFAQWLITLSKNTDSEGKNTKIYDLKNKKDYERAVIDYISSMTDIFAVKNYKDKRIQHECL